MTSKLAQQKLIRNRGNHLLVATFFLLLCVTAPVFAADYLADGQPDGIALLAPPPAPGSPEQAADLASARAVFHGRTVETEAGANTTAKLTLFNFTPAIGEFFQPGKFPKLEK